MIEKVSILSIILSNGNKHTQLHQDILLWSVRVTEGKKPPPSFRFTDIGNWLIENHRPFLEEYASSHMPKSFRLHTKRNYIQSRINDLVELHLIEKYGTVKAKKNNTDTPGYYFTHEGIYFAWLIEAVNAKGDARSRAIEMVFNKIMFDLSSKESSVARFLVKFLTKCREKGIFPKLIDEKMLLIDKFPLDANFIFLMRFFSVRAILGKDEIGRVFIETIKESDEKTQRLLLFQFKLDIESQFTGYFTKEEWEVMRYDNIQDYTKLTLQGYCTDCEFYPFQLDVFEFLQLPFIFTTRSDAERYFQKIDCIKCGKPDGLEIVPIWIQSARNLVMYISPKKIEEFKVRFEQEHQQE